MIPFSQLRVGQHFRIATQYARYEVIGRRVGKKVSARCYVFAAAHRNFALERDRVGLIRKCVRVPTRLYVEQLKTRSPKMRRGRKRLVARLPL